MTVFLFYETHQDEIVRIKTFLYNFSLLFNINLLTVVCLVL